LIFYLDFDHRITDIVADEAEDLAMPAEQQLGMDWRDIPGIPADCRLAVSDAIDRCITAGGIHFCDLSAELPSGHRDYRLKIQRNARQTHVVVHMTVGGKRASQRRVADFRGGRRVSDIDFRQSTGPTHVCPSQVAKAIGVDPKTIRREIKAGELQAHRVRRDWKIPYPIARAYVLRMMKLPY
jgi:excisionase family DNA binding protein